MAQWRAANCAKTAISTPERSETIPAITCPSRSLSDVLNRGQERFNVYCTPCHGRVGDGNGFIPTRGLSQAPPSYHIERLRKAPIGYFFDVMTNGFGVMQDYSAQVAPRDRWANRGLHRALQLSQNATSAGRSRRAENAFGSAGVPRYRYRCDSAGASSPGAKKPEKTARTPAKRSRNDDHGDHKQSGPDCPRPWPRIMQNKRRSMFIGLIGAVLAIGPHSISCPGKVFIRLLPHRVFHGLALSLSLGCMSILMLCYLTWWAVPGER